MWILFGSAAACSVESEKTIVVLLVSAALVWALMLCKKELIIELARDIEEL